MVEYSYKKGGTKNEVVLEWAKEKKAWINEGKRLGVIEVLKKLHKEEERLGRKDPRGMDSYWAVQRLIEKFVKELESEK